MLQNLDGFIQSFTNWDIPFPAFSGGVSAWTELIRGALLMLGVGPGKVSLDYLIARRWGLPLAD